MSTIPTEPSAHRSVRYYLRYLCDGYTVADAFRPQPGWGSKGYTVEADHLGEHTDEDVIRSWATPLCRRRSGMPTPKCTSRPRPLTRAFG